MLKKKNKLSLIFCLVLISSGLFGEIAHNHSHEIHHENLLQSEFHDECISCFNDLVSNDLEFASYHLFFSNTLEIDQFNSATKDKISFFLSRAPPK